MSCQAILTVRPALVHIYFYSSYKHLYNSVTLDTSFPGRNPPFVVTDISSIAYIMADRPIGLDQVKALFLEDRWARIIHMTKEGRISQKDFVAAAVATKSPESLARLLCGFIDLGGLEYSEAPPQLPPSNETKDN